MARISNYDNQVVEFYGISGEQKYTSGKPKQVLLGVVKFQNESDYKFFKNSSRSYLDGIVDGEVVKKKTDVPSYRVFDCNRFTKTVYNKVLAK